MSLKLNSSGGGSITLQEPSTASNRTLTLPDNTGTVVSTASTGVVSQAMLASGVGATGPAFSAYRNSSQTGITAGVFTKVQFNVEYFDTANCYDSATNYRFTPNVAGYYHFSYCVLTAGTGLSGTSCQLWINGSTASYGNYCDGAIGSVISSGSTIYYMNGTTDYAEVYVVGGTTSGTVTVGSGGNSVQFVRFSGALVRAA